ncbi:MAG: hypothetical protein WD024_01410 [Bacillota bacterium]
MTVVFKIVLFSVLAAAPVLVTGFFWVRREAEAAARLSAVEHQAAEALAKRRYDEAVAANTAATAALVAVLGQTREALASRRRGDNGADVENGQGA